MSLTTVVVALVAAILGGGGVGALTPVFRFKADKSNVIAVGAEAAVASLTAALARSDTRVTNLEAENKMLLVTIEELRIKVEAAQDSVRLLTRDLSATKTQLDEILKEQ
jgi:chromosome segregation ATPase